MFFMEGKGKRRERDIPNKKALNNLEFTRSIYLTFHIAFEFLTRKKKSVHAIANKAREMSWMIRPANMMFRPTLLALVVSAVEAMPPPRPWRTRQRRSQAQKKRV